MDEANGLDARSPLYKTLVGAKLGFYMTGYRVFNFRFHSLTWVDFTKFINQVQLYLFPSYLFRQNSFMRGGFSPLATLWNCTIVYLIIATNAIHTQIGTSSA